MIRKLIGLVLVALLAFASDAPAPRAQLVTPGAVVWRYAEGTCTPTDNSGAALTFTGVVCQYVIVNHLVHVTMSITWPTTANAAAASVAGLPFTAAYQVDEYVFQQGGSGLALIAPAASTFTLFSAAGTAWTNTNISTSTLRADLVYITAQ